jgi:hypothetical protein
MDEALERIRLFEQAGADIGKCLHVDESSSTTDRHVYGYVSRSEQLRAENLGKRVFVCALQYDDLSSFTTNIH